ncbi:hypothetical protein V8G54_032237, partial [Vigna mungo]
HYPLTHYHSGGLLPSMPYFTLVLLVLLQDLHDLVLSIFNTPSSTVTFTVEDEVGTTAGVSIKGTLGKSKNERVEQNTPEMRMFAIKSQSNENLPARKCFCGAGKKPLLLFSASPFF